MSNPQNPGGNNQGPGGQGPYGPQSPGSQPQQGGYGGPQQGGPPQQGGYGGPQQGGPPQQGGYGQPQQGGYGQSGPGGYQQGGYQQGAYQQGAYQGHGGPQPPQQSSNFKILAIILGALVVVALGGLAFALLGDSSSDGPGPIDPTPTVSQSAPPETPSPEPTETPTTTGPTEEPSPSPTPEETETSEPPPANDAIPIGHGMSVTLADGWSVAEQTENSVVLRDPNGRGMVFGTGRTDDPPNEVVDLVNSFTETGTNVRKSDVINHDVAPDLIVSSQWAVMTVAGGGGSSEVGVFGLVSSRTSDQIGFVAVAIMPAADIDNDAVTGQVDAMLNSVLNTQVQ